MPVSQQCRPASRFERGRSIAARAANRPESKGSHSFLVKEVEEVRCAGNAHLKFYCHIFSPKYERSQRLRKGAKGTEVQRQ